MGLVPYVIVASEALAVIRSHAHPMPDRASVDASSSAARQRPSRIGKYRVVSCCADGATRRRLASVVSDSGLLETRLQPATRSSGGWNAVASPDMLARLLALVFVPVLFQTSVFSVPQTSKMMTHETAQGVKAARTDEHSTLRSFRGCSAGDATVIPAGAYSYRSRSDQLPMMAKCG
jgi:hypothetical protein